MSDIQEFEYQCDLCKVVKRFPPSIILRRCGEDGCNGFMNGLPSEPTPKENKEAEIKKEAEKRINIERYSRTVSLGRDTVVQMTEYIEDKLLITLTSNPGGVLHRRELMLDEDEAFIIGSLLDDWTAKRSH